MEGGTGMVWTATTGIGTSASLAVDHPSRRTWCQNMEETECPKRRQQTVMGLFSKVGKDAGNWEIQQEVTEILVPGPILQGQAGFLE